MIKRPNKGLAPRAFRQPRQPALSRRRQCAGAAGSGDEPAHHSTSPV